MTAQASDSAPLEDILDKAVDASDKDHTTIGDVMDALGSRSVGPILVLFGLLVIVPVIGAIPGVPAVLGAVLVLFTLQFVFGRHSIWIPRKLENMKVKRERLEQAQDKAEPFLKKLDHLFTERLAFATGPISERVAAIVATILALLMIPLELIPGAVAVPGWALMLMGIGLMAKDGLMMLLSYAISIGALILVLTLIL